VAKKTNKKTKTNDAENTIQFENIIMLV